MEADVKKLQLLQDTHQPVAFVDGYSNLAFDLFHFPPVSVKLQRKVVLMERKTKAQENKWLFADKLSD